MGVTCLLLYHAARTSQKSQAGVLARLQPYRGKAVAADSVTDGFLLGADRKRPEYRRADWGMYRRRIDLVLMIVAALGVGAMIQACGQKGDLYLPKPKKEATKQTATSTKTEPAPTPEAPGSRMSR